MIQPKKYLQLIIAIGLFVTLLVSMGKQSEEYASSSMVRAAEGLVAKYDGLHAMFGSVPHFYQSLEQAVVKEGQTVADLLILDEEAVKGDLSGEYADKVRTLQDLESLMHVHRFEDRASYVVGGYPLIGVEAIKGEETIAVFYGPVRKRVVMHLEHALDGASEILDRDTQGRVRYNRHETMDGQYVVGMYL